MYLVPADHSPIVGFGEMASFTPFDGGSGANVATTNTTSGADLLVRRLGEEQDRARSQIRAGQAFAASD